MSVDSAEHFLNWLLDETDIVLCEYGLEGAREEYSSTNKTIESLADEYATWCEANEGWYGPRSDGVIMSHKIPEVFFDLFQEFISGNVSAIDKARLHSNIIAAYDIAFSHGFAKCIKENDYRHLD